MSSNLSVYSITFSEYESNSIGQCISFPNETVQTVVKVGWQLQATPIWVNL